MGVQSFFSKLDPKKVLHVVMNSLDAGTTRTDLSHPDQYLQSSVIPLQNGKKIAPHIHQPRQNLPGPLLTQESWVVMRGKIRVCLFDLDKTLLYEGELLPGYVLITFGGGHFLECIEENSIIIEFKNGPYLGRDFETFSSPLLT